MKADRYTLTVEATHCASQISHRSSSSCATCTLQAALTAQAAEADARVLDIQRRMEGMQIEFSGLLRTTLDRMHDRLATRVGQP
jgi:hypothetical protein